MVRDALKNRRILTLLLAVLATAVGVAAKLSLTTGELLPGVDGAYYWVQVRSILEDFTLAFDDLPLVFWLQALIAFLVGDIQLGVRLSDALLPALSAIPVYLILRNAKSVYLPALGILVVLLHPIQLYFFTGDFIKNSAAIPLVFFIGWILYNWENSSRIRSVVFLLACLGLLALSHFGTLLLGLLVVGTWLLFQLRKVSARNLIRGAAVSAIALAGVLAGLAILVPARFERLINFVLQPSEIFAMPAYEMLLGGRPDYPMVISIISGQLGALALGLAAWKLRAELSTTRQSLVAGSLMSAFLLSSPLIGMEWANRLVALSFVPLLLAAMIIWLAAKQPLAKILVVALASLLLISSAGLASADLNKPVLTTTQYQDLKKFAQEYQLDQNSIVVARHGLEFLVAWDLKTHVLQESSYAEEDLSGYDAVYYLEDKVSLPWTGYGYGYGNGYGYGPSDDKKSPSFGMKPPMGQLPPDGTRPDKPQGPGGASTNMPMTSAPGMGSPSGGGPKFVQIEGELVYENDSFTLKKVR